MATEVTQKEHHFIGDLHAGVVALDILLAENTVENTVVDLAIKVGFDGCRQLFTSIEGIHLFDSLAA